MGNFQREKFSEISEKTMISKNILPENSLFLLYLEMALLKYLTEATRYNEYLFRMFA